MYYNPPAFHSDSKKTIAIVPEFSDGFSNIVQRQMAAFFVHAFEQVRTPALRQFFHGTDIQIAIVKKRFQIRHEPE